MNKPSDVPGRGSLGALARSWFGAPEPSPIEDQTAELKQRIQELEAVVSELQQRKDIGELDEVELTELASQTAITVVRAAKQRQDEAEQYSLDVLRRAREEAAELREHSEAQAEELRQTSEAEAAELIDGARQEAAELRERSSAEAEELVAQAQAHVARMEQEGRLEVDRLLGDAREQAAELQETSQSEATERRAEADRYLDEAKEAAATLRSEGAEYDEKIRQEADELLARSRTDAYEIRTAAEEAAVQTRAQAQDEADTIIREAEETSQQIEVGAAAEAELIVADAISRRDELLQMIAKQERWITQLVLDDIEGVRTTTMTAFHDIRSMLDSTLNRLVGPSAHAEQLMSRLRHERERLEAVTPGADVDGNPSTAYLREVPDVAHAESDDPPVDEVDQGDDATVDEDIRTQTN